MEQHPIPQPISSYEFRLIGSMTLKQFAKLAACALVALFFYALPLPSFLKWPLIGFFAFLGLGMVFLPINERPLDVWVISFFKAIFSPTIYVWQKKGRFLSVQPTSALQSPTQINVSPSKAVPVFTQTNNQKASPYDENENNFLKKITASFQSVSAIKPAVTIEAPAASQPKTPAADAKTAPKDTFLFAPTQPNIIAGIIKDKDEKLIERVILEIQDSHGSVVRALRSNKLGQFRIATPLPNDTYQVSAEKDGLEFAIIKMELTGQIIPPIEINPKLPK